MRLVRKYISYFLVMAGLIASCFMGTAVYAETSEIIIAADASVEDGIYSVTVSLNNEEDVLVSGFYLSLLYDSNSFEYIQSESSSLFGDGVINHNANYSKVDFFWESFSGKNISCKSVVYTASFKLLDTAPDGSHIFQLQCSELYNDSNGSIQDIKYLICDDEVWTGEHLEIDAETTDMVEKSTMELTANKSVISWQSSDTSVLRIDENGLATAIKPGEAYILAVGGIDNAETASIKIIVSERRLFFLSIDSPMAKKVYCVDEEIDYAGLKLQADYSNYEVDIISSGFSSEYDFSSIGKKRVRLAYGGLYTECDVYVVIRYDANGDSEINIKDLVHTKKAMVGQIDLSLQQIYSVNYGADDNLHTSDIVNLKKHLLNA